MPICRARRLTRRLAKRLTRRLMTAAKGAWGPGRTLALWTGAYLYGSAPLVYWLGRRARVDLRAAGSGNVGATNLLQHGGRWGKALALVGWLFDASKGAL